LLTLTSLQIGSAAAQLIIAKSNYYKVRHLIL
jgi:hypothetical protein